MNKNGDYVVTLNGMTDKIVTKSDRHYVFIPVISQKIKNIASEHTSVVYRRWFQLMQFTLNVTEVYGVPALDINNQVMDGHTSSIQFVFKETSGKDTIEQK